jgi:hypothetical protein
MNTLSPIMAKVTHGMRHTASLLLPIGIRNNVHLPHSRRSLIRLSGKPHKIGANVYTYVSALIRANLSLFWNIFIKPYLTAIGPPGIVPRFAWESFSPKVTRTGSTVRMRYPMPASFMGVDNTIVAKTSRPKRQARLIFRSLPRYGERHR